MALIKWFIINREVVPDSRACEKQSSSSPHLPDSFESMIVCGDDAPARWPTSWPPEWFERDGQPEVRDERAAIVIPLCAGRSGVRPAAPRSCRALRRRPPPRSLLVSV